MTFDEFELRRRIGFDKDDVRLLAQAIVDTDSTMSAKQRGLPVTVRRANELNRVLELAKVVACSVHVRLWPQPIAVEADEDGVLSVQASYADIDTAARQIVALTTTPPPPMLF